MIALLSTTCALALAAAPPDAWTQVQRAAALAADVAPSPLQKRVDELARGAEPLDDGELSESLDAVRAAGPALDALDAALAIAACTLPKKAPIAAPAVLKLGDAALITALADGAEQKKSRAATGVVRALDLAALAVRCKGPSASSFDLAQSLATRAARVAWFLAEHRLVDAAGLARVAAALEPTTKPAALERALASMKAPDIESAGKRLDALALEHKALAAAALDFEKIPRPEHRVELRCTATPDPAKLVVTRAAARKLERSQDALTSDSVIAPQLDGRAGVLVLRAGPIARSCGFVDGDVLLAVNENTSTVEAPAQVARDGFASFRVMRAGSLVEWRIDVAK